MNQAHIETLTRYKTHRSGMVDEMGGEEHLACLTRKRSAYAHETRFYLCTDHSSFRQEFLDYVATIPNALMAFTDGLDVSWLCEGYF